MKNLIQLSAIAALAATGLSNAQTAAYSKPSGYVTETLKGGGTFNLIGLTLHESVVASGALTSVTSSVVSDSDADFDALLTANTTYVLQFKTGTQVGGIQVISAWGTNSGNAAGDLVTPDDASSAGVVVGDTYELRVAPTLSSLFGAENEAGLEAGDITTADVIWLPEGSGFAKFYYSPGSTTFPVTPAGWKDAAGNSADNQPIIYTDGMFIQRRGAGDLDLVITGEVKTLSTQLMAGGEQFNFVSSIFPVGTTLGTSGLEANLLAGDITTGDVIWLQKADRSGYDKFYYSPGSTTFPVTAAGWKDAAGNDATDQEISSGMIIQRRGLTTVSAPIAPPASYSDL